MIFPTDSQMLLQFLFIQRAQHATVDEIIIESVGMGTQAKIVNPNVGYPIVIEFSSLRIFSDKKNFKFELTSVDGVFVPYM